MFNKGSHTYRFFTLNHFCYDLSMKSIFLHFSWICRRAYTLHYITKVLQGVVYEQSGIQYVLSYCASTLVSFYSYRLKKMSNLSCRLIFQLYPYRVLLVRLLVKEAAAACPEDVLLQQKGWFEEDGNKSQCFVCVCVSVLYVLISYEETLVKYVLMHKKII